MIRIIQGDALQELAKLPAESVRFDGRFHKGERRSPGTEFKPGQHWRPRAAHWDREWLVREYATKRRPANEIAEEIGCTENNILFWLAKHGIPRRMMTEIRAAKHWGLAGEANGMFGRRGTDTPNWKGGVTPERAACYSSPEWAVASLAVWRRDFGTCQRCGDKANDGAKMHIHHIVSFAVLELRTELTNLVLLCVGCHPFIHSNANIEKKFIK